MSVHILPPLLDRPADTSLLYFSPEPRAERVTHGTPVVGTLPHGSVTAACTRRPGRGAHGCRCAGRRARGRCLGKRLSQPGALRRRQGDVVLRDSPVPDLRGARVLRRPRELVALRTRIEMKPCASGPRWTPRFSVLGSPRILRIRALPASLPRTDHRTPAAKRHFETTSRSFRTAASDGPCVTGALRSGPSTGLRSRCPTPPA